MALDYSAVFPYPETEATRRLQGLLPDPEQVPSLGLTPTAQPSQYPNLGFTPSPGTFGIEPPPLPSPTGNPEFDQAFFPSAPTPPAKLQVPAKPSSGGFGAISDAGQAIASYARSLAPFDPRFFSISGYDYMAPDNDYPDHMHHGVDYGLPMGTPIIASFTGPVHTYWNQWLGNVAELRLPDGRIMRFAHLAQFNVRNGQIIQAGQQLGLSGASGNTHGAHLHFELLDARGNDIDPRPFLAQIFGHGSTQMGGSLQPFTQARTEMLNQAQKLGAGSQQVALSPYQYPNLAPQPQVHGGHAGAVQPGVTKPPAQPPGQQHGPLDLLANAAGWVGEHVLGIGEPERGSIQDPTLALWYSQNQPKGAPSFQEITNSTDVAGWYGQRKEADWPDFEQLDATQRGMVQQAFNEYKAWQTQAQQTLTKSYREWMVKAAKAQAGSIIPQAPQDVLAEIPSPIQPAAKVVSGAPDAVVGGLYDATKPPTLKPWAELSPEEQAAFWGLLMAMTGTPEAALARASTPALRNAMRLALKSTAGGALGKLAVIPGLEKPGTLEVAPPGDLQAAAARDRILGEPPQGNLLPSPVAGEGVAPARVLAGTPPVDVAKAEQTLATPMPAREPATADALYAVPGITPDTAVKLVKLAQATTWKGFLGQGPALVQELAETPLEQKAAVAQARIQQLTEETKKLEEQAYPVAVQPDLPGIETGQAAPAVDPKLMDQIAHNHLTLGVYKQALKDMTGGFDHELTPTFRTTANHLRNPYVLTPGHIEAPADANLLIRYNVKMRNVMLNQGARVTHWFEKNFNVATRSSLWQLLENPWMQGAEPKLAAAAKALRLFLNDVGLYLADERGLFDALRSNYWPRIIIGYRDPVTGKVVKGTKLRELIATHNVSPLNTDSPRFHTRNLQDGLDELENRGWIVQKDPAQVIPMYLRSVSDAVANQNILDHLATSRIMRDGKVAYVEGLIAKGGPTGYRPIFVEGAHPANPKLQGFIHPDVYRMLEYQFKTAPPSIFGNQLAYKAVSLLGEWYREGVMVNPLTHGINQLSHQLAHTWLPPRLWVQGHFARLDPALEREAATYTSMRPHRAATDFNQALDGVAAGIKRYNVFGADIPNPVSYAIDRAHTFLFDFIIGNAQAMIYKETRDKYLAMGMNPEQARLAAGAKADRIVGMQDPATRSYFERTVAPMLVFSPMWTKSHLLQLPESVPGLGYAVLKAEHPFLTPEALRALNLDMTWATIRGTATAWWYAQLLNQWLAGHPTSQNEPGRNMDLEITQFARDHFGYTGRTRLYMEQPSLRYPNWYFNIPRAITRRGDSAGDYVYGGMDWVASKMMPPWTVLYSMLTDENSATATERVLKGLEQGFPFTRPLQAASGGDQFLTGYSVDKIRKGIGDIIGGVQSGDFGAAMQNSPEAQSVLMTLAAWGVGENPSLKRGPVRDRTSGEPNRADITLEWMIGMELLARNISPARANQDQREQARAAVEDRPDAEGYYRRLDQKYADEQAKAVEQMGTEAGIDLSLAKQQEMEAAGARPMDLLDALHKREIFDQHPGLELWHQVPSRDPDETVRAVTSDNAAYHATAQVIKDAAKLEQQRDDAALQQGMISPQTWRDRRIRRLQGLYDPKIGSMTALLADHPNAIIDRASYDKFLQDNGKPPRGVTRFDAAYEEWHNISLDDPAYQFEDGTPDVLKWKAARDAVLNDLPADQVAYIKQRESQDWSPTEFLYHQLTNQYLDFEQEHADAVRLYHQMYQQTNTPLDRKLFEAQHPELFTYIIQRALWFRAHPLAAEFFQHGYGLQKSLIAGGVSPFDTPAEQIANLLQNPGATQGLDLSQVRAGAWGAPPGASQSAPAQSPGSGLRQSLYQFGE